MSDHEEDLTASENSSIDYKKTAPESTVLRAEYDARELADEIKAGRMKKGELVVRAMSGFKFTRKGKMWTPTPATVKKAQWDDVLCSGYVASLSDSSQRPIVETGYWHLKGCSPQRVFMTLKPTNLYAGRNIHFRKRELVMWLDTATHSYALQCPDSMYEPRWQNTCGRAWIGSGRAPIFKDLASSDGMPTWWPSKDKARFSRIQALIKQQENQSMNDVDDEEDGDNQDDEDEDGGDSGDDVKEGNSEGEEGDSRSLRPRRQAAVDAQNKIARASGKDRRAEISSGASSDEEESQPTTSAQTGKNKARDNSVETSPEDDMAISSDDSKDGPPSRSQSRSSSVAMDSPEVGADQVMADIPPEGDPGEDVSVGSRSPSPARIPEGSAASAFQVSNTASTPVPDDDEMTLDAPEGQLDEQTMTAEVPASVPLSPVGSEALAHPATTSSSIEPLVIEDTRSRSPSQTASENAPRVNQPVASEEDVTTSAQTASENVPRVNQPVASVEEVTTSAAAAVLQPQYIVSSDPGQAQTLEPPLASSRSTSRPTFDIRQLDFNDFISDADLAKVLPLLPAYSYNNPGEAAITNDQDLTPEFTVVGDLVAVFGGKVVFTVKKIREISQELGRDTKPWSMWHEAKNVALVRQFLNVELNGEMLELMTSMGRIQALMRLYGCAAFIPEQYRGPLQKRLVTRMAFFVAIGRIRNPGRGLWIKIHESIRDWNTAFEADPDAAAKSLPVFEVLAE